MRREAAEEPDIDVVVLAFDVGVGVVDGVVLPVPQVGAAAHQVERQGHHLVDPRPLGVGLMSGVVLDVEPDGGDRQAEHERQGDDGPPTGRDEQEQQVGCGEPGKNARGLEVHLRAVAAGPAGFFEVGVDPAAQLAQEAVAGIEFKRPPQHRRGGRGGGRGGRGECV